MMTTEQLVTTRGAVSSVWKSLGLNKQRDAPLLFAGQPASLSDFQ